MDATTVNDTLTTLAANLIEQEYEEPGFYSREPIPMTLDVQIPTAIAIWLLIIVAIIGNVMTIVAYVTDKNLHTVYNYYIFHLAFTDLLMAVSSMSVHSIYVLKGMMWSYGKVPCKIWLAIDFTLCLQVTLLMLILSVDRIMLVSLGMKYSRVVTMKAAHIQMVVSWIVSFVVYGPAIIWWEDWTGESWVPYDIECDIEFANNAVFTAATAMFDFTLPFVCLTFLNMYLYFKIRGRNRVKPKPEISTVQTTQTAVVTVSPSAVTNANESNKDDRDQGAATSTAVETHDNKTNQGMTVDNHDNKPNQGKPIPPRRDAKALRFLSILVIVFLVCWAPYTVTTMVISFCEVNCIDINLYEWFMWFLWAKYAINPFLYALNSQVYRAHFERYIKFWKR